MKKIIIYPIIFFISFFLSFELLSNLSSSDNVLKVNNEVYSPQNSLIDKNVEENVYFIGDSYASTSYANESYPKIFKKYFQSKGYNFIDLSKSSSELIDHKIILDSIGKLNPKLIIYFYNISDIISLSKNKPALNTTKVKQSLPNNNNNNNNTSNFSIKKSIQKSASITFLKQSIQYLSVILTDRFYPGTDSYNFPIDNLKYKDYLIDYFNSINAEHLIIFVNTPFTAGSSPIKWEQYKMFSEMDKESDYTIIQSVDIIKDSKYSESFRNSHPNQDAIKIIADRLITKFNEIL